MFASSYSKNKAPIKEAVGISYDEEQQKTPVISSKGEGAMAEAIVDMANELGLYVHRDEQLLNQLKCLKEGEEIPRELFEVIAQILAFSYLLQGFFHSADQLPWELVRIRICLIARPQRHQPDAQHCQSSFELVLLGYLALQDQYPELWNPQLCYLVKH